MLHFDKLSYWEKETYINHTDYLIIGSGIVGLSTAIHLKELYPDKKVTILERGYLPTGASSKNAGFSCIGSPSELLDDLQNTSEDTVFKTVEKRWKGLLYLRELLGDTAIDYQTLGSYELFRKNDNDAFLACQDKLTYLNHHLKSITGIPEVYTLNTEICKKAGFDYFKKGISHAAEGQINTGKMLNALVHLAHTKQITILNSISAISFEGNTLLTSRGEIQFQKLAICTNGFAKDLLPKENIAPARAQVMITSPIPNLPFKGIYHFDKGYYYFRNVGDRVLLGGGRNLDFTTETTTTIETTEIITTELKRLLKTAILPNHDFHITDNWAGIMGVGKNKTPIIKQLDKHVFCGVRLGGMGVAIGTLVGKELATLIIDNS